MSHTPTLTLYVRPGQPLCDAMPIRKHDEVTIAGGKEKRRVEVLGMPKGSMRDIGRCMAVLSPGGGQSPRCFWVTRVDYVSQVDPDPVSDYLRDPVRSSVHADVHSVMWLEHTVLGHHVYLKGHFDSQSIERVKREWFGQLYPITQTDHNRFQLRELRQGMTEAWNTRH